MDSLERYDYHMRAVNYLNIMELQKFHKISCFQYGIKTTWYLGSTSYLILLAIVKFFTPSLNVDSILESSF